MAFLFIQEIFLAATASFHRVFFAVRQQSEGQRAVYAMHLGRLDDVVPGVDGEVPELAVLLVEVPDVHGVVVGDELVAGRPLHHVDLRLEVVRLVGLAHLDDAEHHDEDGRPDVQVLPLATQADASPIRSVDAGDEFFFFFFWGTNAWSAGISQETIHFPDRKHNSLPTRKLRVPNRGLGTGRRKCWILTGTLKAMPRMIAGGNAQEMSAARDRRH
jgi:hypothetical protein